MDYLKFVEHHRETDADITLGCLPCDDARAQDFGLMKIDDEGNVIVRTPAPNPSFFMCPPAEASACRYALPGTSGIATNGVMCISTLSMIPVDTATKLTANPHRLGELMPCCDAQDFAEKPKGDELKAMMVDTTILGVPHSIVACSCVSRMAAHSC